MGSRKNTRPVSGLTRRTFKRIAGLDPFPQPAVIRTRNPVVLMHGFGLLAIFLRGGTPPRRGHVPTTSRGSGVRAKRLSVSYGTGQGGHVERPHFYDS